MKLSAIPADNPLKIKGVYVAGVTSGSPADEAGLQTGDVIESADQQPVATVEELLKIMNSHENQALLLGIRRGNSSLFLSFSEVGPTGSEDRALPLGLILW